MSKELLPHTVIDTLINRYCSAMRNAETELQQVSNYCSTVTLVDVRQSWVNAIFYHH